MSGWEFPPKPEAEPLNIKEQLRSLKGAEIKDLPIDPKNEVLQGKDVFIIEVTDRDIFQAQAELQKMVGAFANTG